MNAWHFPPNPFNQLIGFILCHMALHIRKHVVRNMLESNIQIFTHILFLPHHSKEIPREMCWIGIMQADPLNPRNISHLFNEFSDMLFAVKIHTIISEFLGNDIKFFRAIFHQLAHLIKDSSHWPTLMTPRNQWYRTIGTMPVTPFRDLQIRIMPRCGNMTPAFTHGIILTFQIF